LVRGRCPFPLEGNRARHPLASGIRPARRGAGAKAGGLERTIAPRAYSALVALYRERKEYGAALSAAREFRSAYPAEAGVAGIDAAIEELEGAAAGKSPDLVALEGEWARAGKGKTAAGRSAGVRLARLYLADYSRRAELVVLLREIHATLPRDFSKLQRRERADYAAAESMLGNVLREQGAFADAAVFLLTAGTLYAPVDVERASESLYGRWMPFNNPESAATPRARSPRCAKRGQIRCGRSGPRG
jgi:hypothetical protein